MSKSHSLNSVAAAWDMEYIDRIPKTLPDDGRIVVHNHVRPARWLGMNGFRAWLAPSKKHYEVCPCGWAPWLPEHYRVRGAPYVVQPSTQRRAGKPTKRKCSATKTARRRAA
jgi:hypothetical protein